MIELGSEYNLSLSHLTLKENNIFKYLSGYHHVCYFDSGRSALKHLAQYFSLEDEILMPEFICDSVTNCFYGEAIKFYKLDNDFSINVDSIESHINKRTKVIFLMHYFGAVQPIEILRRIERLAKEHDCIIIEDTTHSIFSKKSTIGDYQICSIRKWLPIPSGGVLYSNRDVLGVFKEVEYKVNTDNERSYGMILKDLFLSHALDCNAEYRQIFTECEIKLDQNKDILLLSDFAHFIASCIDVEALRQSRIDNYRQLKDSLYQMNITPAIKLGDGSCPLVLPIRIKERDVLRSFLMNNRIYCAVHWPFDGVQEEHRAFAADCSRQLISLPIDQRYGKKDICYLVDAIHKYGEYYLC